MKGDKQKEMDAKQFHYKDMDKEKHKMPGGHMMEDSEMPMKKMEEKNAPRKRKK